MVSVDNSISSNNKIALQGVYTCTHTYIHLLFNVCFKELNNTSWELNEIGY